MKRYVVPAIAGLVVFGSAAAFAASITINNSSLGAGTGTLSACNASATVTYNSAYDSTIPGYGITTTPIATAAGCANKAFRVTLYGAANASLGEKTGTLDGSGNASPDFTAQAVSAAAVTGVAVVIAG